MTSPFDWKSKKKTEFAKDPAFNGINARRSELSGQNLEVTTPAFNPANGLLKSPVLTKKLVTPYQSASLKKGKK
jgi:hypothetical protein